MSKSIFSALSRKIRAGMTLSQSLDKTIMSSVVVAMTLFVVSTPSALAKDKVLTLALTTEPPNLNHVRATDTESFFILGHTMEGLTRYDKSGAIVPGVAEKWTLGKDKAVFHLRANAKWSDGKPVTAHDFVFSWRLALDPKTASEYAFILYPIKNGEAINKGSMPTSQLGVKALDDRTLEIQLEKPCGYFLALTSFAVYYPMREDFNRAQGDKYAANAENLLANGAFKLTKWVHGASLRMDKNENYWNAKSVALSAIDIPYITPDDSTRFNLYKNSKIDLVGLTKDTLISAQKEKLKLQRFPDGTLFFLQFNFRPGKVTANKNLRKAIELVFNPAEHVSKVVAIPGTIEGTGLIPSSMPGLKKGFRKEYPLAKRRPDVAKAKQLMELAKRELKLTGPLQLVFVTGDTPLAVREAEYMQALLKSTLGIELKIDRQIFKQRLAKAKAGDFDIVSAGWGPDYNDPMTFADLFTSWNGNNNGKWVNAQYDSLIKQAMEQIDPKQRLDSMAKAEQILLDELPIIPTYERTLMYTHDVKLMGLVRRSVGFDPDFTQASLK